MEGGAPKQESASLQPHAKTSAFPLATPAQSVGVSAVNQKKMDTGWSSHQYIKALHVVVHHMPGGRGGAQC